MKQLRGNSVPEHVWSLCGFTMEMEADKFMDGIIPAVGRDWALQTHRSLPCLHPGRIWQAYADTQSLCSDGVTKSSFCSGLQ